MAGKISMGARREVVSVVTERYRSAKRAEKGRILDELCATTGWHRKHAVRALRRREAVGPGERAGPGCLDSAPLDLSGFLPGYAERGALRFCRCVGRA
ncbi:hypothetical protein ACVIU7_009679 [Bradyrhizobium liaoningense]|nr:hypothetical protein GCM10007858_44000 [Bradyrhizobium liaoningense]